MKKIFMLLCLFFSPSAFATWYSGTIEMIAIGYDGKTISVGQAGFTRTDCTCYSTWPNRYCLDRTRESFKEEYALLLSAKARKKSVKIRIDDTTYKIVAMYEN